MGRGVSVFIGGPACRVSGSRNCFRAASQFIEQIKRHVCGANLAAPARAAVLHKVRTESELAVGFLQPSSELAYPQTCSEGRAMARRPRPVRGSASRQPTTWSQISLALRAMITTAIS